MRSLWRVAFGIGTLNQHLTGDASSGVGTAHILSIFGEMRLINILNASDSSG
jgi:hypothetical protein